MVIQWVWGTGLGGSGMHRVVGQGSFAEALVRGGGNARLEAIASLLDWARLEVLLQGIHSAREGRPSYPPLVLVKVLLLQGWYGLGDPAMEEALGDRIFPAFAGAGCSGAFAV